MRDIKCPACGSGNVELSVVARQGSVTLGGPFVVDEEHYVCANCGESGDFAMQNDVLYDRAEKKAAAESIPAMIEELSRQKVSMARFERAFELPQRTMTRWKTGDFSATSLALLRTVSTCPWLVDVAEEGFDSNASGRIVLGQALKLVGQTLDQNASGPDINGAFVYASPLSTVGVFVSNIASNASNETFEYQPKSPLKASGE